MEKKKYYKTLPSGLPDDRDALEWEDGSYPCISSVVSAQECTGMMPVLPEDEEEEESYRSLFTNEIPGES